MKSLLKIILWTAIALAGAGALAAIAFERREPLNAVWFVVAALCTYVVAFRFYSKFIAAKVLALDDTRATPAERLEDGHDFVPTSKWVLIGHHFAAIAGPGPAKLTIKNRSSIPADQVASIRRTLERDLQSYGVTSPGSAEVATVIRVTLSQNLQHELWIAEVQEGTEVKVVMVRTDPPATLTPSPGAGAP